MWVALLLGGHLLGFDKKRQRAERTPGRWRDLESVAEFGCKR
jgi:hypothetical protein